MLERAEEVARLSRLLEGCQTVSESAVLACRVHYERVAATVLLLHLLLLSEHLIDLHLMLVGVLGRLKLLETGSVLEAWIWR